MNIVNKEREIKEIRIWDIDVIEKFWSFLRYLSIIMQTISAIDNIKSNNDIIKDERK
jgi:hypothetical protein